MFLITEDFDVKIVRMFLIIAHSDGPPRLREHLPLPGCLWESLYP